MSSPTAAIERKPDKRDHRQEVTDSIVKMLEEGVAPWQRPWEATAMPFNPTTERQYRGGNAIHLMTTGLSRGYEDPRWITYKQAAENGWQVRKGEKGTHIEFWKVKGRSNDKSPEIAEGTGEPPAKENGRQLIHRVYTVFNARQIDGVPAYSRAERPPFDAVQRGERTLVNSGARIAHDQRNNAFYNRSSDSIHLPPKEAFKDAPGYYGTALHELAHWTGHSSRLNRSTLTDSYRFGDLNYAKEELRAELASVFIAAEVGIPHDPANHAAYVDSWIKALKEDKNEIFRAAHDASAATDFVLGLDREVSRAEALANSSSRIPSGDTPARQPDAAAQEEVILEEIEALQTDRMRAAEGTRNRGVQSQRENSEVVARYELERRKDLSASFAATKALTSGALGESARTFTAQTQSGIYNGKIIAETDCHLVQRLSQQTAVAHMKHLLNPAPHVGDNVVIAYAQGQGQVRDAPERIKNRELVR